MERKYEALSLSESESSHSPDAESSLNEAPISIKAFFERSKSRRTIVSLFTLSALLLIILLFETIILWNIVAGHRVQDPSLISPYGLSTARTVQRKLYSPTKYSSANRTIADAEWDRIHVGHGVVAIDKQWANSQHLPSSVTYPNDTAKSLYVIEAYHVLHCIKVLRLHYLAIADGKEVYWAREHDYHCFDALRQFVMCNADGTLLSTTGHRDAGRGQTLTCRDWDALSQWAGDRGSCYHDREPTDQGPLFGSCGTGDGLPVGSVLE